MSVLRSLEDKIAGLVEGTFSRAFRVEVRPVEIARRLAREMDLNKSVSVSTTYAPNEYQVYLSPDDRERLAGYEPALVDELAGYLLEHARRERLELLSRPTVQFETDDRLRLGEFGIQARLVRSGRALLLVEGKRVVVGEDGGRLGRSRDCEIVLADPNVSRHHAALRPSGGAWMIEDLGSTNGVKVNGRRIDQPAALTPGDRIELGTAVLTFELE
jgi:hypothetical protein